MFHDCARFGLSTLTDLKVTGSERNPKSRIPMFPKNFQNPHVRPCGIRLYETYKNIITFEFQLTFIRGPSNQECVSET